MTTSDPLLTLHGEVRPVDRAVLEQPAPDAARALLGTLLVRDLENERVIARIVETEAYREDDPASHSFVGRTARTDPMFRRAGTSYVYRSYGIHWCLNISAEKEGTGAAVLIRAAAVIAGFDPVRARRGPAGRTDAQLLRGPGVLARALGIDRERHGGIDLITGAAGLGLMTDGWGPRPQQIRESGRVGVSRAADVKWRYFFANRPEVSSYRRSARASRSESA